MLYPVWQSIQAFGNLGCLLNTCLKSLASRHKRRRVGSTGRGTFHEKSSTIEAANASKSITLKAVLKNSVRRKRNLRVGMCRHYMFAQMSIYS